MRLRVFVPAAVLLAVAVGCTTPQKRYEQASEDEAEGRWASAAAKYIDVLRRDPEYPGAREKAIEAGNRAIQGFVRVAGGLESAGRYDRALEEYAKTDRLTENAAVVGVVFDLPGDYLTRKRETMNRAAEEALAAADRAAADARWYDATKAYRRAETRYALTEQQRERAREGRFRALLAAAEEEMENGRYDTADTLVDDAVKVHGPDAARSRPARELRERIRGRRYGDLVVAAREQADAGSYQAAYRTVGRALEIYGDDSAFATDARELRDRIVREGTVGVVAPPLRRPERLARRVPAEFLMDVDDILAEEYWSAPPMFVEVVVPRSARRRLRRFDRERDDLTEQRAAAMAREFGARFVAVSLVTEYLHDAGLNPEIRGAATRDGRGAEVRLYRRRTLGVRCTYRLVDARDGSVVCEGAIDRSAGRRHIHATCDARLADELLLTREEHSWFDARRLREVDRELEREIAQGLAEELAGRLYDEITQRLP